MYRAEQIKSLFGDAAYRYLENKQRGGASNEKGSTYENYFAVYQLARLAREACENQSEICFMCQIYAFVDDLVIDGAGNKLRHYQLKNSRNVFWGKGLKSIADDFSKQYSLNQSVFRSSELFLVVSNRDIFNRLASNIPANIQEFSQVFYFPYEPQFTRLIEQIDIFHSAIVYLSAFDTPEPDKIECVATALLGAWMSSRRSAVTVLDVLAKAQACSPN